MGWLHISDSDGNMKHFINIDDISHVTESSFAGERKTLIKFKSHSHCLSTDLLVSEVREAIIKFV